MTKKPRNSRLIQFPDEGSPEGPPETISWHGQEPMPEAARAIIDGITQVEPIQIPGREGWWHVISAHVVDGINGFTRQPMERLEYRLVCVAP